MHDHLLSGIPSSCERHYSCTSQRIFQTLKAGESDSDNSKTCNCWRCDRSLSRVSQITNNQHPASHFYCPHGDCQALQPPSDRNHFEQLGFSTHYDIDTDELTRAYRKIQQRLHPDMAVRLSEVSRLETFNS